MEDLENKMQKHRKLAAIMFTDIVGYTSLMAKDEDNALKTVQKHRDITKLLVKQFNGEWLKEMGDGTLSSFGSVVDAVNCAIEIQHTLKDDPELNLRIGIHVGDVMFVEGDIYGDGVNIASRIEPLAEPGCICVTERVYYDIRNKLNVNFIPLGEKKLKNIDYPIKVYALTVEGMSTALAVSRPAKKAARKEPESSIAVLPFMDMSDQKDQEYFCDGMSEELINALVKIKDLRVAARTSAFQFKGKGHDIHEIGEKLKVQTVLEGSVRKTGKRLRITAQLIKVADGYHLWSEQFDREMEDIFAIQEEISMAIVDKLNIKLLRGEKTELVKHHTKVPEAFDLYLKGLYYWNKRNESGMKKATEYFQKAIEKDPNCTFPSVGIADTRLLWPLPQKDVILKSKKPRKKNPVKKNQAEVKKRMKDEG